MWKGAMRRMRAAWACERGAAMVEYAIVAAGIAVVALVAVQALGSAILDVFWDIINAITSM